MRYHYKIGIDCGTNTGVAIFDVEKRKLIVVKTMMIHQAIDLVEEYAQSNNILLCVENPNTWIPFEKDRTKSNAKLQGAGSVKRDFAIWKDFAEDKGIEFISKKITGNLKKIDADLFKRITGWDDRTSSHSRDASFLVFEQ